MRILLEAYGCTLNKGEALELRDLLEAGGAEVVEGAKGESGHIVGGPQDGSAADRGVPRVPAAQDGHLARNGQPRGDAQAPAGASGREPRPPQPGFSCAVVFTCIVIDATEQQMVRRVKELSASIGRVHVLGCLPPTLPHLLDGVPGVSLWDIDERAEAASAILSEGRAVRRAANPLRPVDDLAVPFPIASGCLGSCAYCLTKRARGDLRSRSLGGLALRFDELHARGYREFRLTSQDAGVYGADTGTDLNALLDTLLAKPGDFRIRVGMMNPLSLRRLMPAYLDHIRSPRVYRFLHLPVQSGSDRVLGLMNRGYRAEEALELVQRVRAALPDLTLSTDVITGFPTETEAELEMTLALVERMRPSIVNVTRFSPRPGTPAMRMRGQLPGGKSKEFSRVASERTRAMVERTLEAQVGRRSRAFTVAREVSASGGAVTVARTDDYLVVRLPGDAGLGRTLDVTLDELDVVSFRGRAA